MVAATLRFQLMGRGRTRLDA